VDQPARDVDREVIARIGSRRSRPRSGSSTPATRFRSRHRRLAHRQTQCLPPEGRPTGDIARRGRELVNPHLMLDSANGPPQPARIYASHTSHPRTPLRRPEAATPHARRMGRRALLQELDSPCELGGSFRGVPERQVELETHPRVGRRSRGCRFGLGVCPAGRCGRRFGRERHDRCV
jgi:hypothetical protein